MDFQMSMTANRFQAVNKAPMEFKSPGLLGGLTPAMPPVLQTPFAGGALGHSQAFFAGARKIAAKK